MELYDDSDLDQLIKEEEEREDEHKQTHACIVCGEELSPHEKKAYAGMGDVNCKCWRKWMEEMKFFEHSGKSYYNRDRLATEKVKEWAIENKMFRSRR